MPSNDDVTQSERLDRWLCAARMFKTRGLAAEAIRNGRVTLNGERAKPAKMVRRGDAVTVRRPPYEQHLEVRALAARRQSAALAQTLYVETAGSIERREALSETLRMNRISEQPRHGKLNKKERREREQFKRTMSTASDE